MLFKELMPTRFAKATYKKTPPEKVTNKLTDTAPRKLGACSCAKKQLFMLFVSDVGQVAQSYDGIGRELSKYKSHS